MTSHAEDDGFHEIQLNGKQLVFVFMAATVVSVVIFLCGVLVGRGVQSERALAQGSDTPAEFKDLALNPSRAVIPPTVKPGSDPTLAAPPTPPAGEQTKDRPPADPPPVAAASGPAVVASGTAASGAAAALSSKDARSNPKADDKKPAPAASAPAPAAVDSSKQDPPRDPVPADAAAAGDAASDWVVQVAATKARGEADTIAKRLGSKGYSAFVLAEGTSMFRVRVGGYKTKREADAIAAKLRKEERIKPWVTQRRAS